MVKEKINKAKTADERYELTKPFFEKELMGIEIQKITGLSETTICTYKKRYCYENNLPVREYHCRKEEENGFTKMTEDEKREFRIQWKYACNLVRKGLGLGLVNYG